MKLLLEKNHRVEDRRAKTSRDKPSLLVQETCHRCGVEFVYIVAAADASNVTDLCGRCCDQQLLLSVYDNVELLERRGVWNIEEAEERLRDVTAGRHAILRLQSQFVLHPPVKSWRFEDGQWRPENREE